MENSLKGLILAAGTIITCIVISLGFYISREAKSTASSGTQQINKINTEFAESDKVIYDGTCISGSEVVSVIQKFNNSATGVYVQTNSSSNYYIQFFDLKSGVVSGTSYTTYSRDTDASSSNYINPYATFKGQVVRDSNDVIVGIAFRQV